MADCCMKLKYSQAGINIFVEKPLSVKPVEEVDRLAQELKKVQDANDVTIAVGYMLRYSPAVEVQQPPLTAGFSSASGSGVMPFDKAVSAAI